MKKILSLALALSLLLGNFTIAYAEESNPKRMNRNQLQVAASYFFWRVVTDDPDTVWRPDNDFQEPIPLYDNNDEIIAYYIKTVNNQKAVNGYMIVDAFIDNPCVLEYGYGESANIIDSFRTNSTSKVYYGLNGTFSDSKRTNVTMAESNTNVNTDNQTIDMVALLSEKNYKLHNTIMEVYNEKFSTSSRSTTLSDWGIIKLSDMPSGSYTSANLSRLSYVSTWATTSDTYDKDTDSNLKNNCGPTSGTNMLLYYGAKLRSSFMRNDYKSTITELYNYMGTSNISGTGPYGYGQGIRDYMANYYPSRTVVFDIYNSYSWETLKSNIANNKITAAYLWANTIVDGAHYVNYVGWRSYSDGSNYVRITTQWSVDDDKYILYGLSHTRMVEKVVRVVIS